MRVRISYGVEIEDVPAEASNLIGDALNKLKDSVRFLSRTLEEMEECKEDFTSPTETIEKTRLKLSNADAILVDATAILEGLQNYYNGDKNVSERRPTVDPSGDTNEQTEDPGQG